MRKHPYHLVDPSPWPLFAGLAAFVTTIGAVMYFHAYVGGGLVCSFGLLMVLYSMFVWWRDSARGRTLIVWTKSLDPDKRVQRSLRSQGASCWHTRVPAPCTMDISTGCTPAVPNQKRSGCSWLAILSGVARGQCFRTALRALRNPPLWGSDPQAGRAWTLVSSDDRLQAHGCPCARTPDEHPIGSRGTERKQQAAQRVVAVGSLGIVVRDPSVTRLLVRLFRFAQQPHRQRRLFKGASCLAQHLRGTYAGRGPKGVGRRPTLGSRVQAPSERAREGTPAVGKQCVKGGDKRFETPCSRSFVLMNSDRTSCCIRIHKGKSNGRPTHPASDALFGKFDFYHLTQSFQSRTRVICLHSKAPKPRGAIPGGKNAVTFGAAATRIMSTSSSHHPGDTIGGSHVNAQGFKRLREKEPPKGSEALKVLSDAKGAVSLDSDNLMLGLKRVRDDLVNLGARAKVRDQQSVNQIARTLLTDKCFWIVCYELIQYKKPIVVNGAISECAGCSTELRSIPFVFAHKCGPKLGQGVYTLQHLDYFSDLANRVKSGSFNWSPARRVPKGGPTDHATRAVDPTSRPTGECRPLGRLLVALPCACTPDCKVRRVAKPTLHSPRATRPRPTRGLPSSERVARRLCACTTVCEHLSVHKRVSLACEPGRRRCANRSCAARPGVFSRKLVRSTRLRSRALELGSLATVAALGSSGDRTGPLGIMPPRCCATRGWRSHTAQPLPRPTDQGVPTQPPSAAQVATPAHVWLSHPRCRISSANAHTRGQLLVAKGRSPPGDQIVQKGIQMILEQVAGYKFLECSYSFRKSCHHAIKDIKLGCNNAVWAIEVDINKCFDSFDHKRLVSLIRRDYISLQMFLDLLYKALRVRSITLSGPVTNRTGTLASSLVSPLLCNIYLHELDQFVMASQELKPFRELVVAPRPTARWTEVIRISKSEVRMLRFTLRSKGRRQYWKALYKLRKQKIKDAAGIPRYQWTHHTRMFKYFRYADDLILFVWGNLSDAQQIKRYIGNFLKSHLALHLSESNTKVTHLSEKSAKFCGFEIKVPKVSHSASTFRQVRCCAHRCHPPNGAARVTQPKALHVAQRPGTQRKSDLGACTRDPRPHVCKHPAITGCCAHWCAAPGRQHSFGFEGRQRASGRLRSAWRPEVAAQPSANATPNDLRARTIGAVGTVLRTSVRSTPFGLGSAVGRPECTLEECAAKFRHSSIGGSMGGSTTHQTAQPPRWLPTAFGGAATLTRAQRKARRVRASAQQWCARKTHKALPLRNSVVASSHKYPAPMALGRTWVANKVLTPCTSIEADGKNRHFQICHGVAKWRLRHSPPSCGHATREGNQNKHVAHRNGATHPFVSNAGIRINCNKRDILEKLAEKGFVIKKGNKFRPTSYKPALELPLPHIVQAIQRIFQGIAHYYGFADNYWVMNSLFQHYGRICCATTIAHKTRSTLGKVLKKYGPNIEVPIPGTNVRPVRE